ncbi:MAG: DUF1573 domain-containing protein [Saprospiraceae bacterium]|nr:DUF1573 domain-containing protein [Saprospiraceae bacterium]
MKWILYVVIIFAACNGKSDTTDTGDLPRPDIKPVLKVESAPSATQTSQPEAGSAPEIRFEKTRYSFGEIYHADKVHHEFHFTNTGDSNLEIKAVKASCGCTTPTFSTLPVPPGEKGTIGVTYNSVGKQGTQKATIRVSTNDPVQPEIRLYLSGRVLVKPLDEKN